MDDLNMPRREEDEDDSSSGEDCDDYEGGDRDSMYTASQAFDAQGRRSSMEQHNAIHKMTQEDTKQILLWKMMVLLIITGTAALVSTGAYIFLAKGEEQNYQDSYSNFVNTIRDSAEFHASNMFITLRSFSDQITVEAIGSNQEFPFVTIPSFEAMGSSVRSITGVEIINWHVIVEEHQLGDWANYTLSNYQTMLAESRATGIRLQPEGSAIQQSDFVEGDILPLPYKVPSDTGDPNAPGELLLAPDYGPGPYFPAWMTSPPIFHPAFINVDPAPDALLMPIKAVMQARRLVLTDTVPVQNLADFSINAQDHENYHASLVNYTYNGGNTTAFFHPHSAIMVPVFEQLNNPSSRIVGTAVIIFPWDRYLINLLPEGVTGLTCVLRNSCGKAWTYDLVGNSALYRGEGDFHDPNYSHTEVVLPFQHNTSAEQDDSVVMETVPGECDYSYHIFATQEFENDYKSALPWALTLVVSLTFVGMIATFWIYDTFVHRRNTKVVTHATKTNAIVDSLFPTEAKNRLLEDEEEKQRQRKEQKKNAKNPYKVMEQQQANPEGALSNNGSAHNSKSDPIANLHPECTVYFADIAGFTSWSSKREPVEVFKLLEAIYSAFDELAKRRGVFKVETIGDCYVAITGVPEAQNDHAVRMAKFAWDTRERMRVVTKGLEGTLGADTSALELRVGLHSGPVTAGVLRGEKSRFQLFGDTVNTASRMESNGEKGKIQVSEATAERVRELGRGAWLTAREDLIEAKGKGKMQTYWLEINRRAYTSTTSTSMDQSATNMTSAIASAADHYEDTFADEPLSRGGEPEVLSRADEAPGMTTDIEV
ncbi:Receptor-type guanylate cyclase gcy [Seminavis robusta]|uniref:Receptor-type guanylate cyclase gcy n=1 Tax=Seminavis robusta TaxID=568900 RepID=A0A9N8DGD6_9STRA|nr:Receptor-type guanylate cyclase gcy [Seminavis robusta]|eukprot:Sro55_g032320.1 Receptor-type guanylate cyclase gcy (824) ;mRNA; f:70036-73602